MDGPIDSWAQIEIIEHLHDLWGHDFIEALYRDDLNETNLVYLITSD